MRGTTRIINSKKDAQSAGYTDEQIIAMATISVRHDKAVYPGDYNNELRPGEDGYIEADYVFEEEIDQSILTRFGVDITSSQ